MNRDQVIASVAGELHATEAALDSAIVQAATLVQSMIGARTELSLSPVTAAASQAKAMETIAALSAAREAIVACHAELQKDHRRMGWGTYAFGILDKPPETQPAPPATNNVAPAPTHLRAV
ncbi:MAG: hypothetical protein ACI9YM_001520 [Brevundimonas sp.]|uniref:hypothetical protein n=1 Tax=Brevundimonas sp. TaxID=1871086 RepID=UPI002489521F|nr:hypothetical protein [Brevundimonas sp.]MDI1281940.1 hypothetical protein [Brevundimonas sp.]